MALHLWWVHTYRTVGSFDVDETGYLAAALRYDRNLGDGIRPLAARVAETITGPLVPLLAVPLVRVFGGVWAAQAIQPLLHLLGAIAVTGIVYRIADRRAAVIAGLVVLTLPATLLLDRSNQFATAAGAFLCCAVWALLASDRGQRTLPMILFGAATAAMVLSRTMAVGFVPALAVGSLVWTRWDRRSLANLAVAAATLFVLAGLWWLQGWDGIMGYLQRSGYSEFAGYWGANTLHGRIGERAAYLAQYVRWPFLTLAIAVLVLSATDALAWRRAGRSWRSWPIARRDVLVIWIVVAGGWAALFTTSNTGSWFDLPLNMLSVAGLAVLMGRRADTSTAAPIEPDTRVPAPPVRRPDRRPLGAVAVTVAVLSVIASVPGPTGRGGDGANAFARVFYYDVGNILTGNFDADPRLESGDQAVRFRASKEWEQANEDVVAILETYDVDDGRLVQSVTGSAHLININTLLLASELSGHTVARIELPITFEDDDALRGWLRPFDGDVPRIIVRIRSRSLRFPDDRFPARYDRLVKKLGWTVQETVALPDGGKVEILTHPDSDPLAPHHRSGN